MFELHEKLHMNVLFVKESFTIKFQLSSCTHTDVAHNLLSSEDGFEQHKVELMTEFIFLNELFNDSRNALNLCD